MIKIYWDKKTTLKHLFKVAKIYDVELKGKKILFVCKDKQNHAFSFETYFDSTNFLHLTGLKFNVNQSFLDSYNKGKGLELTTYNPKIKYAHIFYQLCIDKRLKESDFDFDEKGFSKLKLDVIENVICKNLSAKMIGDYNGTYPKLYTEKIVGNIRSCIGFIKTNNKYAPDTLLKLDMRGIVKGTSQIIATFRKNVEEEKYSELVYTAKKVDFENIEFPRELEYLKEIIKENICK